MLQQSVEQLQPVRCALTVVLFPDRRAVPPGAEPGGGDKLAQLYYSGNSGYSTGSSSISGWMLGQKRSARAAGPLLPQQQQQQQQPSGRCSSRDVLAGIPGQVAAVAYDPVAVLLLAISALRADAVSAAAIVVSGVLGVALRALAAEGEDIR